MRDQKYDVVQQHYQHLEDLGFEAYPPHLQEVAERIERKRKQEKLDAKNAHARAVRNEQHLIAMHLQLQRQMDIEA